MTTTTNIGLNQPAYNSSAWDVPLNANETILDNQLAGTTSIALTNTNVTLTSPNGSGTGQTQAMRFVFTGAIAANIIVTIPAGVSGRWIVSNQTTGSYTVTLASGGGGTTAVAPQGYNIQVFSDGTNVISLSSPGQTIPSGTVMLFHQTTAPTGFTKITTYDNYALRIVNGTVTTGGSNTFTGVFNSSIGIGGTTNDTAITIAQMPSHYHQPAAINIAFGAGYLGDGSSNFSGSGGAAFGVGGTGFPTASTGGNQGHNHTWSSSFNLNVRYIDFILAQAN